MSDDNEQNLLNYKLQLQQVEAALELDKDNAELLALKTELDEIIGLTLQLLGRDPSEAVEVGEAFGWKVGDHCSALWARDRQYYPAVITEVRRDGTCFVSFAHLPSGSHAEQCQVSLLKPLADGAKPGADVHGSESGAASLTAQGSNAQAAKKRRREERTKALEAKMRKVAKRAEREKEMEAVVEQEKKSWQSFSKKIKKQGRIGKSIFATPGPDNPKGRVGVGTCGIAGKGMTPFAAPQYRPPGASGGGAGGSGAGYHHHQYPPSTTN
ncbi:hypothetical protein BOX15_Mlig019470g1 [Macrostomum lignano]|uniref:Tudor domain-containing protein n=1 Tax=Macrostomum lignano TaxID=282301 RepID=A0A267F5N8_9PLAT|nr:hypothetical protein BOX15_Mlig019470g1 [Macrostomum lignano]